jgi:serine/threonine protein kinase
MNNMRRPTETRATKAAKIAAVQKKEDPLIGAVIQQKYRIVDVLGEGGMGSVYLAKDEKGKDVAVKVLHQSMSSDDAIARFFREVKATITVDHPNIVEIYDYGLYKDKLFCVMECLPGSDLLKIIRSRKDRRMPWKEVRPIIIQLCSGLAAAHNESIIHRDLKPGNIFIVPHVDEGGSKRDRVKILDFGLAKNLGDGNDNLTKTATIMGTFKYMAPEQTLGKKDAYDHRADIYAVGIIMYELLTGDVPFKGENVLDLLEKIRNEAPVRPRILNDEIPGYVEEIILKAIEKDQRKRFQTMRELREAIVGGSKRSKSLGDILLANAMNEYRVARPVVHNVEIIPAEELGVAVIPDEPEKLSFGNIRVKEPAFTENLGNLNTPVFEEAEETQHVKKKRGWFGKLAAITALALAAGGGYYYWDRIRPHVMPYVDQAKEYVERELEGQPSEPAKEQPLATKFRATIETSPPNATVYLEEEGRRRGRKLGTTGMPLVLSLDIREHTLIIEKSGRQQEKVTVSPQNPNVKVNLRLIPRRRETPIDLDSVEIEGATDTNTE